MRLIDADELVRDIDELSKDAGFYRPIYEGVKNSVDSLPTIDAVPVVRCKDCIHRNKKKCPLVMVRLDVKTNGTIKEVLEQNYVDEDFWCKDGEQKE